MRIGTVGWLLLLLCISAGPITAAELPRSLDDIPVFPGAVRNLEREEGYSTFEYVNDDDVVYREIRAYMVNTFIDDVVQFYIDHTQATKGWPGVDMYELDPGESVGPWYSISFYSDDIFKHIIDYGVLLQDGNWTRQAFSQRPQWEPGKWLQSALFTWDMAEEDGKLVRVTIDVGDGGYDWRERIDYRTTYFEFEITVRDPYYWAHDWDDDWDDWDEVEPGSLMEMWELFKNWAIESDE